MCIRDSQINEAGYIPDFRIYIVDRESTVQAVLFLYKKKTPRLTRGSVNATHLTKNPPCLRIIMRSANCIKVKKED